MLKTDGVLWHITASLDGFVADSRGRVDLVFDHVGPNPLARQIMDNVGAILIGRRTYDRGTSRPDGKAYGGRVRVPQFVVTNRPAPVTAEFRFLPGDDLPGAVSRARAWAEGKLVVILGPTLAASCLAAGLIDQVAIHVVPVLLGGGTRLFESPAAIKLEMLDVSQAGAVTNYLGRPRPRAA